MSTIAHRSVLPPHVCCLSLCSVCIITSTCSCCLSFIFRFLSRHAFYFECTTTPRTIFISCLTYRTDGTIRAPGRVQCVALYSHGARSDRLLSVSRVRSLVKCRTTTAVTPAIHLSGLHVEGCVQAIFYSDRYCNTLHASPLLVRFIRGWLAGWLLYGEDISRVLCLPSCP